MKIRLFQQYLLEQKIDLALFFHPDPTINYFIQMEPSNAILSITPKKSRVWLTSLDKRPLLKNIILHNLLHNLKQNWEKEIKSANLKKIGLNHSSLTLEQFKKVKKLFPKSTFIDITRGVRNLRKEKTTFELQCIKEACCLTSQAFHALTKELPRKNLKTELDVAFFLEKYIQDQGAEIAFPTIAAMGKNAATPHHKTSLTKLSKGFLLVDFGAKFKNYCADMTRILFLGKPTAKEKAWYDLLLKAQMEAINSVQEGISFLALDTIVRKKLGKYSSFFIHSLGHGLGIEVHEAPVFSDKQERVKKNVPFTIEPGIYLPGKVGLRIEDTLVWDGKKVEILTKVTKDLIAVDF